MAVEAVEDNWVEGTSNKTRYAREIELAHQEVVPIAQRKVSVARRARPEARHRGDHEYHHRNHRYLPSNMHRFR